MERLAITVKGIVQGVGFRPFIYELAWNHQLGGFARNHGGWVEIEVEGRRSDLDRFVDILHTRPPSLSDITSLHHRRIAPLGDTQFRIIASDFDSNAPVALSPDIAPCPACLAELSDPGNRRYQYPFINCTQCGPRLTIIQSAPYDRERTTMAAFEMCAACRVEYETPGQRRFHAQPNACPVCGPWLSVLNSDGNQLESADPLTDFIHAIGAGQIGAMKSVGGFHLVCDARNETAVAALRRRKHRAAKPLAIMVHHVEQVRQFCQVGHSEQRHLESPARPIVLLHKRTDSQSGLRQLADSIAPRQELLGVMLPSTPLHSLILDGLGNIPVVMTSGNQSDEPIVFTDPSAVQRLSGISDLILTHNRPINSRCDDSVVRVINDIALPIRRSRGFVPRPIALPFQCPRPILALGGEFKNVFALAVNDQAFLSPHVGDLQDWATYCAFLGELEHYDKLFQITPQCIAHDLHPDHAATLYARRRALDTGIDVIAVQHHHAHLASCMAENGLTEPVIGVTFDGTGYGNDGTIWGGEFLVGDYSQVTRVAHLGCARMPGGELAIHEPWRMAFAYLRAAGCDVQSLAGLDHAQCLNLDRMLVRGINSPWTSSAGRLIDAVAVISGVGTKSEFEGQLAMELEGLASNVHPCGAYPFSLAPDSSPAKEGNGLNAGSADEIQMPFVIDTRPMIRAVAQDQQTGSPVNVIARRFHSTLMGLIVATCVRIRSQTALDVVVLTGGVMQNALLLSESQAQLERLGFRVYRHRLVPAGDGGICLGQLAVAAHGPSREKC